MKVKKFEEYKQAKPLQLSLFFNNIAQDRKYTNTIELYDTLPKYYYGNQEREKSKTGEYLPILKRQFEHRGIKHSINISPAAILNKEGKTIHYYPSQREELVEDALRKLACDGRGVFLNNEMGFSFSLYEVQQELKKNKHGYNINEIKEALEICASSMIEIKSEDGEISLKSPIFSSLGLKGNENHTQTFVRFHPLVSLSIKNKSYRQLNYPKYMKHKKMLSRWLHKRLSHYFIQASTSTSYDVKLSTIVINSGMKAYKQITSTREQIIKSLEELTKDEVVGKYTFTNLKEGQRKNQITDVMFFISPHASFIQDVVKANLKKMKITKLLS